MKLILKIIVVMAAAVAAAQTSHAENYRFRHITMADGLSHNQINDIYKDTDGFMWYSTAWGLNRYDGYEMTVLRNVPGNSTTLANNYVHWARDISADHMLVVSSETQHQYQIYDKRTGKFSNAADFFAAIGMTEPITRIYVDKHYNVWFASNRKCFVYNHIEAKLTSFEINGELGFGDSIIAFAENENRVSFLFADGMLASVALANGKPQTHATTQQTPVKSHSGTVSRLFIDSDNDAWITIYEPNELWHYESSADKWHRCDNTAQSIYRISPDFNINGFAEDRNKRVWIVSDHGGISIVDKHTRNVTSVMENKNDDRSILSNSINRIYCDNQGIMWLGYFKNGISLYDETIFKFDIDNIKIDDIDPAFKADINAIEEDMNGNLWLGTNGSGLLRIDRSNGRRTLFKHNPSDPSSLPSNVVVDLLAASDGSIWIATFMGGLCRYDGRQFVCYRNQNDLPNAMTYSHIWALDEDEDKNIWIGSLGGGVASYNLETRQTTEFSVEKGLLSSDVVLSLIAARNGKVFVGTGTGVCMIDPPANTSKYLGIQDDKAPQLTEYINDIYQDSRGLVWIATRSGLAIYDSKNEQISTLTMADGLVSDVATAVVEDNDKNMWVTTVSGVSNIAVNINPRTKEHLYTIYNYSELDGLQQGSFNIKSIKKTSYGTIIMGGSQGINYFESDKIQYNKNAPTVRFTDLAVFGEKVGIGQSVDNHVILDEALIYSKRISLDYAQNMFTISFSTLSYALPEKVKFSYILEGFNNTWLTTNTPSVTYTNLTPGKYTLKAKAANCDGFGSDAVSELQITILPPWWKANWAYAVYIVMFFAVCWFIRLQIMKKEREKYKLEQVEVEAQRRHEIDNMKLKFFTNISHELRTPLSLIISPLENLMDQTTDEALRRKLELIHRNAVKLLNMVNQLLDFRKADMKGLQLNASEGDIVAFIKDTCSSFAAMSEYSIDFNLSTSVDSLYMDFDKDKVGKIMSNILSNAFKFTPEGGKVDVWIGKTPDNSKLMVKISDTGIGIPDEFKSKIFERFYQVPRPNSNYAGSGIGLHMAKEFATLHGGDIEVGDNVGHGTTFVLTLPITAKKPAPEAAPSAGEEAEPQQQADGKKTIVIVDDNADFRTLLYETLHDEYNIIEARNGDDALETITDKLPDLIISDIMMPGIDGIELCKRTKNDIRTSHIPIILLTAKTAEEHKIEGLSCGADDYVTKPFNPQILKLKISRLIELGKKRQETFKHQIEPEPSKITITPLDEKLIDRAIQYVEDNMSRSELSVEEMSKSLGMSRVHLYKKLLSITGRSPIEFIRVIRLKRAAQMLRDKQQNVADVAYAVGFNNPKYFSKYFREEFGMLPSAYQNSITDEIRLNDKLGEE